VESLLLLNPSANRVYAQSAPRLAAAELALTAPFVEQVAAVNLAGLDYLGFRSGPLAADELRSLARQSAAWGLFEVLSDAGTELLRPVQLPADAFRLPDDLVTIPKYQGKTNEVFTQLLLNQTLAQVRTNRGAGPVQRPLDVLDPLAGRGTTLLTAWRSGCNGFGVEADAKSFEAFAAYLKTYLRRARLSHRATTTPVRREHRLIGQRFDAELHSEPELKLTMFTGDTRDSARLFGKQKFDAIVTDAPYGVAHGALNSSGGQRARQQTGHGRQPNQRSRSPEELLREAIPVWAGQLRSGGALGISWNTLTLAKDRLLEMLSGAGLEVLTESPWDQLDHRVDSSIHRDLVVAVQRIR
jgi:hypothetical protein